MVKIIWTDLAVEDLKSIHDYISKDSKSYANKFVERLLLKVDQLEEFPNLGRKVPEFNLEYIRELIAGNYRIVYKVNANHIGIVRIHHSASQLNLG